MSKSESTGDESTILIRPDELRDDPSDGFPELSTRDVRMVQALTGFARTLHVGRAARCANITRDTWYRWLREVPGFAAAVERIKEATIDEVEAAYMRRAQKTSDAAAKDILRAWRRDRYGDQKSRDDSGVITEAKLNQIVNAMAHAVDSIIPNSVIPEGMTGETIKQRIREEWLDIVTHY